MWMINFLLASLASSRAGAGALVVFCRPALLVPLLRRLSFLWELWRASEKNANGQQHWREPQHRWKVVRLQHRRHNGQQAFAGEPKLHQNKSCAMTCEPHPPTNNLPPLSQTFLFCFSRDPEKAKQAKTSHSVAYKSTTK